MKKLFVGALFVALLLPALPGGAQNSQTNDTTSDTDPTTELDAGSGVANRLLFAGAGTVNGLEVEIGGNELDTVELQVNHLSASGSDCTAITCADAAGALEPAGAEAEARRGTAVTNDTVDAANLDDGAAGNLEAYLSGRLGEAQATTSTTGARSEADGAQLELLLTDAAVADLSSPGVQGMTDNLIRLDQALAALPQGDPALDEIEEAVSELRADLTDRPLVTMYGGDGVSTSVFSDRVIRTESTVGPSIITVIPTDQDRADAPDGLFIIEIGAARSAAAANGTARPATDRDQPDVTVTMLPGVLEALCADSTTDTADIVRELPTGLLEILPPDLRTPAAANAGVDLDRSAGALRLDLGTTEEESCFLSDRGLQTCVEPGGFQENFDPPSDPTGVVVLTEPVAVGLIPEGTGSAISLELNRTQAGATADFTATSTSGSSSSNSSSGSSNSQTNLPRTGSRSTVALPALGLMLLSGLILVSLRRREG